MKKPQAPPDYRAVLTNLQDPAMLLKILNLGQEQRGARQYLHWDRLRRYPPPPGVTSEQWWLAIKMQRIASFRATPLTDNQGSPFNFSVPELVLDYVHRIDVNAGRTIGLPEQILNPQTRDQYLIRSLMEEAITSSQLEGAATTREVAKEMIRTGRPPRDKDEQMIVNNYLTMQRIATLKDKELSPDMVFQIHKLVTEKTLDDETAAGRLRTKEEYRIVGDDFGEVFHEPPTEEQLPNRLSAMCDFANAKTPDYFIHPVIRAIVLHFWLAYDHPFVDGNGRTARALFYWEMLRNHYWLFEYISISSELRKAPIKYGRSFLYTETDNNDLTYFVVAQTKVIDRAIKSLHDYVEKKSSELRALESHVRALNRFNHRQVDLIRHALKHPYQHYSIESHRISHNIVYETARTDLMDLKAKGVLEMNKKGKQMVFSVPNNLPEKLSKLGKTTK